MTTTESDLLREAIRWTLENRAGDTPDARAVATATLGTWHQIAARLVPVIGTRGVDSLFGRAVHLSSRSFPVLAIDGDRSNHADVLARIRAGLEHVEATEAAAAGYALLTTFIESLTTLIGTSLTARLLHPVWELPAPAPEQETVP